MRGRVSTRMRRPARNILACAAVLLMGALVAACGGGSTSASSSGKSASSVLTVNTGASGDFTDNFNPFSPDAMDPAQGLIYEPLYFFDTADAAQSSPWLATSYSWSNGGKTLTFQLRHHVQWTDGKPFTSTDVVYTFNLIKSDTALNGYALPLAGASADGPYTAVINFTKPAYNDLDYAAGLTYILPEHIWKSVSDPATYADPHPVGTGAYELSEFSGSVMKLTANPHYYIVGLPHFKTLEYLAFKGNTSSELAIEGGQIGWGSSYIPDIKKEYLDKSPDFYVDDIPLAVEFLVPNLVSGPTKALAVRQAMSYAIDRPLVSQDIYQGYAGPTNPAGLLTPDFSSVLDPSIAGQTLTYSVADAKKVLEVAGYKMGGNGIFVSPSGKPLDITVQVISGYTDYVQSLQIIAQEMKAAGINLTVDLVSASQFTANQDSGNFQLLIDNFGYTPLPFVYYNDLLDGATTPPIGQTDTVGNYGRYNNPSVNAALAAIAKSTSITASVKSDYYAIEQQFVKDMPLIPLFNQQAEEEFDKADVTGYPTPSNPYADDSPAIKPDDGWTAARLQPAS